MLDYEIIVVGAGPSGCAAALMLAILDADLAEQTLLLDKAVFPRPKLCAGGVTNDAELILRDLRVGLEVASVPIHVSKFLLPHGALTYRQTNQFRVVRRMDFDYYLLQRAHERGIVTNDGEAVENITRANHSIVVQTSKNEYRAKIVIGADGANSTVRKLSKLTRMGRLMVALEIFVPTSLVSSPEPFNNMAVFDFSLASYRVPGYFWIFPTVRDDPVLSMGLMEAPFQSNEFSALREDFAQWLKKRGLDLNCFDLQAHPALRYEPRASCSEHRFLFVGDAAGIDPLFGEGITSALATGIIAAQSAFDALRRDDFSFSDYEKRIRSSYVGTLMRRRCILARRLYGKHSVGRRKEQYDALLNWVAPIDQEDTSASITWEEGFPECSAIQSGS